MQAIAVLLIAPAVLWLADDPAAALIDQLGSPSFSQRQDAAERLQALRRSAAPALLRGLTHADCEVRDRCRFLLPRALRSDLRVRLDALLENPAAPEAAALPCWDRFRERFGAAPAARHAFARMLWAEPVLFRCLAERPKEFKDAFEKVISHASFFSCNHRAQQAWEAVFPPDRAEALIFLAIAGQDQLSPEGGKVCEYALHNFAEHHSILWKAEALSETRLFRCLTEEFLRRRPLNYWTLQIAENLELDELIQEFIIPEIRRRVARMKRSQSETSEQLRLLWIMVQHLDLEGELGDDLRTGLRQLVTATRDTSMSEPEMLEILEVTRDIDTQAGQPLALRFLANKSATPRTRAKAIQHLCFLGDEAALPYLEKLFDEQVLIEEPIELLERMVNEGRWIPATQLRDVALAAAVYLNHQPLADYGFPIVSEASDQTPDYGSPSNFKFADNKSRQRAFALWAQRKHDRQQEAAVRKADAAGARLLRQLGSTSYPEREAATQRLRLLGERALPLLQAGTGDNDPEVAQRCRRLLRAE